MLVIHAAVINRAKNRLQEFEDLLRNEGNEPIWYAQMIEEDTIPSLQKAIMALEEVSKEIKGMHEKASTWKGVHE